MTIPDRTGPVVAVLGLVVLALFVCSLLVGPTTISLAEAVSALSGRASEEYRLILREIRLPRAFLGAMVGASLGLAGAVLQGLLRNPLAEPGLIGVSASASLGAAIAIYTGLSAMLPLALPVLALVGGFLASWFLLTLAGNLGSGRGAGLVLILAGIAVTSLASSLTSLVLNYAPNPFAALEIVFWILGSLADRSLLHVEIAAPFMIAGWVMLALLARPLDLLTLGEDTAQSLGVNVARTRTLAILGAASAVGAATAVSGAIGFVGLIVPHLLRPLVGARPGRLLLASALGGAALLLTADIMVRLVAPERDLKLGVVTALVGAPFFLWLLARTRRSLA